MGILYRLAPLATFSHAVLATDATIEGLDLPELVLPELTLPDFGSNSLFEESELVLPELELPELVLPELMLPDFGSNSLLEESGAVHVEGDLESDSPPEPVRETLVSKEDSEVEALVEAWLEGQSEEQAPERGLPEINLPFDMQAPPDQPEPVREQSVETRQSEEQAPERGLPETDLPLDMQAPPDQPVGLQERTDTENVFTPPPQLDESVRSDSGQAVAEVQAEENEKSEPQQKVQISGLYEPPPLFVGQREIPTPPLRGQNLEVQPEVESQREGTWQEEAQLREVPIPIPSSMQENMRSCSANHQCQHLAGNCCPTNSGLVLDCCTLQSANQAAHSNHGPAEVFQESVRSQFLEQPPRLRSPPVPPTYSAPVYERPLYEQPLYAQSQHEQLYHEQLHFEGQHFEQQYEQPQYGQPQYEELHYEQPQHEQPHYGQPSFEQPHYDQMNPLGLKPTANTASGPTVLSQHNAPNDFVMASWR